MAIFIPPPLRLSQKCQRCGLRYPFKSEQCVHCTGLSERELEDLKEKINKQHKAHKNLGMLFMYIAILIFIAMLVLQE